MINRRDFIKTSTFAAAGMFAAQNAVLGAGDNLSRLDRVGLQVWSIAKFLEEDLEGGLEMLARVGYKELELYGPYPFSTQRDKDAWNGITKMVGFSQSGYFGRTAKDFKQTLDRYGLSSPAMHVGLDTLRNNLGKTAEAANILGQRYAGIAAIPQEERSTVDDYKHLADEFNIIGENAKKLGIRFYYHNHGYGLKEVDGIIPFNLIIEGTDPSLVYFEMDIFWHSAGGADPLRYLANNPGRFKLMHIKDMSREVRFSGDGGDPRQWIELFPYITDPGNGILDIKAILSTARKSGVEHFIFENDVITNPKLSLEGAFKHLASLELEP